MINKMRYLAMLAVAAIVASTFGVASAATGGGGVGLMTLHNPSTGQQILVLCINGTATHVASVIDGEAHQQGVSIGTPCTPLSFEGYETVFNLDPRDGGWVINSDLQGARACTENGAVFASIDPPATMLSIFERTGYCGPGAIPG